MKRSLFAAWLAVLATLAWALPTVQDVDAEVQKGHYAQAESMMQQVVVAKPQSARAHYVYAQILAHNGRFSVAAAEETRARHLDPAMKFSKAEDVRAFEQFLEKERRRTPSDGTPLGSLGPTAAALPEAAAVAPAPRVPQVVEPRSSSSGFPGWVWPAAIIVLLVLGWRMARSMGRSAASSKGPATLQGAAADYGSAGTYPPSGGAGPGMGPAPGGGLLGVGLAAAGGVAAGMVAERLLERGHEQHGDRFYGASSPDSPLPDPDARALEDRSIDFGTGNDWSDGSGLSDVGGGSDDGSW